MRVRHDARLTTPGVESWQPIFDEPPRPRIWTVVRWTEDPVLRRAVRIPSGWVERGTMVDGTGRPTPILWERTGRCWAEGAHWVVAVAVEPEPVSKPYGPLGATR